MTNILHLVKCLRKISLYHPHTNKPLLSFRSSRSKLVKRGIVKMCLTNALKKSCQHLINVSFTKQVKHLCDSEYPNHIIVSVAEGLLRQIQSKVSSPVCPNIEKNRVAFIPYMHGSLHCLKKIAQRNNIPVAFSMPNKFSSLCKKTTPGGTKKTTCEKNHQKKPAECIRSVVYQIPTSCGACYIGQTGR